MYFDSHIHTEGLGFSELKRMREEGITNVCSPAFFPIQPKFAETMIDVIRKLSEFEVERVAAAGIAAIAAVGIHPRCIPPGYEKVLEFLESGEWVAFGEIGLETGSEIEVEVLRKQLELAKKLDVRCVIHTPRSNKREVTKKTLKVLEDVGLPHELAVIDHVSRENLDLVLETDCWIGLTVQPGKLSEREAAEIVKEHGAERFMLNSDAGYRDSDFLSVARAAKVIDDVCGEGRKVAFENARKFFG